VSGYLTWGITAVRQPANATGPQRYVIWTAGIDSANAPLGGRVGAWLQEATWSAYISGVAREVNRRGGSASPEVTYTTVTQPWTMTPNQPERLRAPDPMSTWRYGPPPLTMAQVREREIRKYANSCTSDRRNCPGPVGEEARRILDGPPRAPLDLEAFMRARPAPRGAPANLDLLRAMGPLAVLEQQTVAARGPRFYRDHGAAPGTCANCHAN